MGYKMLPETYIIFICTDCDPVGRGEIEYLINPYAHIKKDNSYELFQTKSNWIVYNASAYKDFDSKREDYNEDLKSFFAFLKKDPLNNDFTDYLYKHFIKVKANEEMERDFMLTMVRDIEKFQEGYDSGFDNGYDSGYDKRGQEEYQEKIENVMYLTNENFSNDIIQKITKLSLQEIEEIRETYSNTSI